MSQHWEGCYELHPACAKAYIALLEAELRKLKHIPCGDVVTHAVVLPLHGDGPTWTHAVDDPPCR